VSPRRRGQGWRLLRDRHFAAYWWGGMISNIGTWLQNVTASVVMLQLTDSPFMVGVLNTATFAPVLLLSMLGGMVSDRFDRRLVVVWSQAFSLLVALAITGLSMTGALTAVPLVVLSGLLGASYAIAKPALSAMLPALGDRTDIAGATAVNTLQFNFGQIVGSSLSALILTVSSTSIAFAGNALSFLGPIAAMYALRTVQLQDPAPARRLRGSGRAGLSLARRSPAITAFLAAIALGNAAVEALRTLAPVLVEDTMGLSSDAAGVLITAYGVGATLGILFFSTLLARLSPVALLCAAFAAQAIGLVGVSLADSLTAAALLALPIGLGFAVSTPLLSAGLQVVSPEEFRGRVMSLFSMAHLGLRPVFSLAAGALATLVDARIALVAFVLLPLVAIGTAVRSRRALAGTRPGSEAVATTTA
jgi:MFS family permease